tara:strand:- start:847 stop:1485 length:639 start_codon:yes stop_codon:yes gene_type:complete
MKLGITQRVDLISDYNEYRDCLDQKWSKLFERLDIQIIPIPNNLNNFDEWQKYIKCEGYILTGGNDINHSRKSKNTSKKRDKTEKAILINAIKNTLPVFGVCRGFQIMNMFLGGNIKRIHGHVANKHSIKVDFEFKNKYQIKNVNSYHQWGVPESMLAKALTPFAFDNQGNIEAAIYKSLNWIGIMWHPEREKYFKTYDLNLIKNVFINNDK